MKNKKFFILLILIFYPLTDLLCQDKDFGLWYEIAAGKSFSKKFSVEGSTVVRTYKDGSTVEQAFMQAGASYDPNKYLGFTGSYRIGNYVGDDHYYHIRHKWLADIKGTLPLGRFSLTARLRLQFLLRGQEEAEFDPEAEYDGRFRIKGQYRIPDFPVDPYVSFETFTPLFSGSDKLVEKSRSTAGVDIKINKRNKLFTEYIYERDVTPDLKIMNIISLGYTYKFK